MYDNNAALLAAITRQTIHTMSRLVAQVDKTNQTTSCHSAESTTPSGTPKAQEDSCVTLKVLEGGL